MGYSKRIFPSLFVLTFTIIPQVLSRKCKEPKVIQNGHLQTKDSNGIEILTYFCDRGYWYDGTPASICQDGQWSHETGHCREVECPALTHPINGQVYVTRRKFNDIARVKCDYGYVYSKPHSDSLICQQNQTWNSTIGLCTPVHCPRLDPPPGGWVKYYGYGLNDRAKVICNIGYIYSHPNSQTLRCQANNTWTIASGKCNEVHCSDLGRPKHSSVTYTKKSYGGIAELTCFDGYYYNKHWAKRGKCQEDSKWSVQFDGECLETLDPRSSRQPQSITHLSAKLNALIALGSIILLILCVMLLGKAIKQWRTKTNLQQKHPASAETTPSLTNKNTAQGSPKDDTTDTATLAHSHQQDVNEDVDQ